jgi:uncharacterized membrane protein YhaH (DUF805 family)
MMKDMSFIISVALNILDTILGTKSGSTTGGLFSGIYGLAVFLPSLAVGIRRLHDTNHSGWWVLIGVIPIVGWIWIIVLLAKQGDTADNTYGPVPPPVTAAA